MSNINDLCAKCHRGRWRHTNPRLPGCHVFIEPGPQPAPTLSTFNQVLAALRNPSVDLGDLDVCKACLSVESPYLHSVGTACPTGPTVEAPQPAPSGVWTAADIARGKALADGYKDVLPDAASCGDEAKVRELMEHFWSTAWPKLTGQ